jgi:DNA-binding CsgD family transcriptional regulator
MNRVEQVQECITGQWKTRDEIAIALGIDSLHVSTYLYKLKQRMPITQQFVGRYNGGKVYRYGIFDHDVNTGQADQSRRVDQVRQLIQGSWVVPSEIAGILGISILAVYGYLHKLRTVASIERRVHATQPGGGGTTYEFHMNG